LLQHAIHQPEIIIGIENIKMFKCVLVIYLAIGEAYNLIQYAEGIAHAAFAFLSDHLQCRFLSLYFFFFCYLLKMTDSIVYRYPLEIKNLATAEYRWKYLMFFSCRKNKYGIRWRLFKRF